VMSRNSRHMENTCWQIATPSQGHEHAHPAHVENVEILLFLPPEPSRSALPHAVGDYLPKAE